MERSDGVTEYRATVPRALTIAGSDSGGCAGIQADLKTFGALGVHGMSAVTAITAQDTCRVHEAFALPPRLVSLQIEAVVEDIGVDAVKTGMLSSAAIIAAVAESIGRLQIRKLVVDPVMVSTGGDPLIQQEAVEVLKTLLLPLALAVTPNLHEAAFLVGRSLDTDAEIRQAAEEIHSMGPAHVIIKGGHRLDTERATDVLFDGAEFHYFSGPRFNTRNTHGSGCTFAAALTAFLARGLNLSDALAEVKAYISEAIRHSLSLGHGHGPLGHYHQFWGKLGASKTIAAAGSRPGPEEKKRHR